MSADIILQMNQQELLILLGKDMKIRVMKSKTKFIEFDLMINKLTDRRNLRLALSNKQAYNGLKLPMLQTIDF